MKLPSSIVVLLAASGPFSSARKELLGVDGETPTQLKGISNEKCRTYSMNFADRDFLAQDQDAATRVERMGNSNIREGMSWGLHALQWKAFQHATEANGLYHVAWANAVADSPAGTHANAVAVPARNSGGGDNHVSCAGSAMLNELERMHSFFFTNAIGYPRNPKGYWVCVEEENALAGATIAAMNIFYWKTPTYVDVRDWKDNDGGVAVIEKVRLCTVDSTEYPEDACNWEPRGSDNTCGPDSLTLKWIKIARFDGSGIYKDYDDGSYYLTDTDWQEIYGKPGSPPVLVSDRD